MQTVKDIEQKFQTVDQKLRIANCTIVMYFFEDFDNRKVRNLKLLTAQNAYIHDKGLLAEVQSLMDDLVVVKHGGYDTSKYGRIKWVVRQGDNDKGAIYATLVAKKVGKKKNQSNSWTLERTQS